MVALVMIAIGIVYIPIFARIVRGTTLELRVQDYVDAAVACAERRDPNRVDPCRSPAVDFAQFEGERLGATDHSHLGAGKAVSGAGDLAVGVDDVRSRRRQAALRQINQLEQQTERVAKQSPELLACCGW